MRRFRSPISLLLCIAVFASMFTGFMVSAAPLKPHTVACDLKPANLTVDSVSQQPSVDCCPIKETKLASTSLDTKSSVSPSQIDCCQASKLPIRGKTQIDASPIDSCCLPVIRGKAQIGVNQLDNCCSPVINLPKLQIGTNIAPDPCAPAVDGSCGITYPTGSVVGNMPFNQQAYYAPGLLATGVTINAGTYWVTGLGKAANGDGFYQIVVACQYLFVPQIDIVPSYQAPWSGQPLPTTPPVES